MQPAENRTANNNDDRTRQEKETRLLLLVLDVGEERGVAWDSATMEHRFVIMLIHSLPNEILGYFRRAPGSKKPTVR